MTRLEQTIIHLDEFLRTINASYAIIGGVSVIIHGLQRTTQDVDITLEIEIEDMPVVAERIIQRFKPKKENPIEFFQQYFVLPVIDTETNVGIDISAGLGGFDKNVIRRAKGREFAGILIPCCTVEDLIIYKIAANRGRDISDVDFMFALHGKKLDKKYLLKIAEGFSELERGDILDTIKKYLR